MLFVVLCRLYQYVITHYSDYFTINILTWIRFRDVQRYDYALTIVRVAAATTTRSSRDLWLEDRHRCAVDLGPDHRRLRAPIAKAPLHAARARGKLGQTNPGLILKKDLAS